MAGLVPAIFSDFFKMLHVFIGVKLDGCVMLSNTFVLIHIIQKKQFMKRLLLAVTLLASGSALHAQSYRIITTIESIVPGGVGRSRIIDSKDHIDYKQLTTSRENGKDSDQGNVDRSDAKTDKLEETKLLNFYSFVGINFQNIASNDAIIMSKLNAVADEGWDLAFVTSGVESDAGEKDGKGIFITRYIFKRKQ